MVSFWYNWLWSLLCIALSRPVHLRCLEVKAMNTLFRTTLRARLGLASCVGITYPYGIESFKSLTPLTPAQRDDLELWHFRGKLAALDRKAVRTDRAIVWLFGAALVCLYAGLDYGLSSWLLGF